MSASENDPETKRIRHFALLASQLMTAIGRNAKLELNIALRDYLMEHDVDDPEEFFTSDAVFRDFKSGRFNPGMRGVVRAIVGLYLTEEAHAEGTCKLCHIELQRSPCRICFVFARKGTEYARCIRCGIYNPCQVCVQECDEDVESIGADRLEEFELFCSANVTPDREGNLPAIPNAEALRAKHLAKIKRNLQKVQVPYGKRLLPLLSVAMADAEDKATVVPNGE